MSFSSSRRKALDQDRSLAHRASDARSCAMRVAEKWRLSRSDVLERLHEICGVDLTAEPTCDEIQTAIDVLDKLRFDWPGESPATE